MFKDKAVMWKVPQCSGELRQVVKHKGVGRCTRVQLGLIIRLMTISKKEKKRKKKQFCNSLHSSIVNSLY